MNSTEDGFFPQSSPLTHHAQGVLAPSTNRLPSGTARCDGLTPRCQVIRTGQRHMPAMDDEVPVFPT